MSKYILEVNNLSKQFNILGQKANYLSIRDSLLGAFKSAPKEKFWALKDVSFNIGEGETIGIIGKNGAGKSTLLKVLSRITPPSEGIITCRGRIASLLEVGTGFHSELSGRENVFMNGSILGMRRHEIVRNFDAIVDFAGVEKFIDTPLKHYSSGMQLRLAFAVAAFLENEILIVDEVLAVGDAEFQRKCMNKMSDVSKSGRTILFVSHNMSAVKQLCERGLVMNQGQLIYDAPIQSAIEYYNSSDFADLSGAKFKAEPNPDKKLQLTEAFLLNEKNRESDTFSIFESFSLILTFNVNEKVPNSYGYIVVKNDYEEFIIESDSKDLPPNSFDNLEVGEHTFTIRFNNNLFAHGRYRICLCMTSPYEADYLDNPDNILTFHITDFETPRGIKRTSKTSYLLNWNKNA